ncbi:hypothetical protein BpHYR1_041060, partial [Brachionus plicatilis]
ILSNKKWGLNQNTIGNLYKSLVGSILDLQFLLIFLKLELCKHVPHRNIKSTLRYPNYDIK